MRMDLLGTFEKNLFCEFPTINGRRNGRGLVKVACSPERKRENLQELFSWLASGVDVLLVSREQFSGIDEISHEPRKSRKWGNILLLTSGTSGNARIVVHNLEELLKSAHSTLNFYGVDERDRWPLSLPIHHIGGLQIALRCLLASIPLMPLDERFYRKGNSLQGVTLLSLVPVQWAGLVADPKNWDDLKKMKAILIGGSSLDGELWREARERGFPLSPTYGMTEMGSQVAALRVKDFLQGEAGLEILPGRKVNINDSGALTLSGVGKMLGFFENGSLVESGREIVTSDRGAWRGERLEVLGRLDNVIISGGKKIDPGPLESLLLRHPAIDEAVLLGLPDKAWGERLHLVYTGRPGLTPETLKDFLAPLVAPWEIPKGVSHCHLLPGGERLKPDRRGIREHLF